MLEGDFFFIRTIETDDESFKASLELNAAHAIFSGHFSGQPVVPGACLLQMIKETISKIHKKDFQLIKANQLKFMQPVDPRKNPVLEMTATCKKNTSSEITVTASFFYETTVCCKFIGVFNVR